MKLSKMPCCGHEVDAATIIGDPVRKPKPGDATICLYCGTWCRFRNDMTARLFGPEDFMDFPDEQLFMMRRVTKAIRDGRNAPRKE